MKFKQTLVPVAIACSLLLYGCSAPAETTDQSTSVTPTTPSTPTAMDKQKLPPAAGDTVAVVETSMGTIKFKLFPDQAPESVKNMEELSKAGRYKDVPFHRVAQLQDGSDFVIQTGDFTKKDGSGGYSYKGPDTYIPNEIDPSLHHIYGAVGMARTRLPDTNGSQFYFVTNKNGASFLDGGYTVFGQVYEGLDIVDAIAAVETDGNDRPLKEVLVKSVTVMPYQP